MAKKKATRKAGISKNVSKTDIIKDVAHTEKVSQAVAEKVIDSFIESVKWSAKNGKTVTIQNFMTAKQVNRKARKAYNFKTGGTKTIPAKKVVKFTVSKNL